MEKVSAVSAPLNDNFNADDNTEIFFNEVESYSDMVRLTLVSGVEGFSCPGVIELDMSGGFATVGRMEKSGMSHNTFSFDSSVTFVSRSHIRLEKRNSGIFVIDLDSKGGTWKNEERLIPNLPVQLANGDQLIFTTKRLIYRVSF